VDDLCLSLRREMPMKKIARYMYNMYKFNLVVVLEISFSMFISFSPYPLPSPAAAGLLHLHLIGERCM
jgi:hypothetical protein